MSKIISLFKQYPRTFWISNTIELIERTAWYGFFMLFANYLTESTDLGGLEFSQSQKGIIMGVGTGILYFLPIITGAIADRYGYKKVLLLAFTIYTSAFLLLPQFHSFIGVFMMYLYLAIGAALFKPIISATIAKTTTNENSSIGFGIFYMMVNIGAFIGPLVTMLYRQQTFYISAGAIALNFILILFYKEPDRYSSSKPFINSLKEIFSNIATVIRNWRFMLFLLIVAGFWTMYNQLFMSLPVFIAQWVDSANLFQLFDQYLPLVASKYGVNGQMEAEFITNFDALFIILFQILISSLVMRMRPLSTMITGFIVATIGMSLTVLTQNVLFTIAAIFIFSIGEMSASPKITEYIGRIAPRDKKALFMGFTYIPIFLGYILAGIISGPVYQRISDKYELASRLASQHHLLIDSKLSKNEQFESIASQMNLTTIQLKQHLWETAQPQNFWMVVFGIGLLAAISLFAYDRLIVRKEE